MLRCKECNSTNLAIGADKAQCLDCTAFTTVGEVQGGDGPAEEVEDSE